MKDTIIGWVCDLYADTYSNMFLGDIIAEATGAGTGVASSIMDEVREFCIGTIAPGLSAVGVAIAITFFLIALVELSTTERLTLEFFIKFFTKLVVSIFVIALCPEITEACINFGNTITNYLNDIDGASVMSRNEIYDKYWTYFHDTYPVQWLVMVIQALSGILIIFIASMILSVIAYIVSFTRLLELGVRAAFMPIAVSLLSDDGWRGSGGRYIRKFIAICCQGGALVIIGRLTNLAMSACVTTQLSRPDLSNTMGYLVMLGVGFASASLMFKSIGLINDVFGG